MPAQGDLDAFYAKMFSTPASSQYDSMHATDVPLARQYLSLVERAIPSLQWKNSRILEYGAGKGDAASELVKRGANVVAVEPYGFEVCNAKGLTTFRRLEELPAGSQFDGIIMTEVAEHMVGPSETFSRLHAVLKENGWLFVTTPNNGSLKARILGSRWSESAKFGHLFLFSRDALMLALANGGFRKVVPSRGFVRLSNSPFRSLPQYLLQILRIDGQLRYIALKTTGTH